MKRYFCTAVAGLLLALGSTGTASATDLPVPGGTQEATQSASFGDQAVGEQKNDADVSQWQGNGNLNIAPAIAVFGDAETTNAQGNGNTATADVDQSNSVDQTQSSSQRQSLEQDSSAECCGGQSQTGEQHVYGGDQTVDKQKNDADVSQWQGNGNLNIAPAIAVFGNAKTANYQGNHNRADADVTQSNSATQSQSATQKQYLSQERSDCCKPRYDQRPKHDWGQKDEQRTSFGDQTVGKQKNDADVTQRQGNGNVNFSPALGLGGKKHDGCRPKCDRYDHGGGNASTWNAQGNGNTATADIDQSNSVDQYQRAYQYQRLVDACKEVMSR